MGIARAMAKFGQEHKDEILSCVSTKLQSKDSKCRRAAITTLPLIFCGPDREAAGIALVLLSVQGDDRTIAALRPLLDDKSGFVKNEVKKTIPKLEGDCSAIFQPPLRPAEVSQGKEPHQRWGKLSLLLATDV